MIKKLKNLNIREILSVFFWLAHLCFKLKPWASSIYLLSAAFQTLSGIFGYYSTAKVTSLIISHLSNGSGTSEVWKWFILLISSSLLSNIAYRLNHMLDRRIYFSLTHWASLTFAKQLCNIDMQDFYDNDIRNTITRLNQGITWQLPNAAYFTLAVFQSLFNTLVTIISIGLAVWWLVPLFILLMIPMLVNEARMSSIGWFVFSQEGNGQTIFWGIMSNFQEVKKQFEIRALGVARKLQDILEKLTTKFYKKQLAELKKTNYLTAGAVVAQFVREAVAQGWLIAKVLNRTISVESYLFYVSMVFRLDGAISGLFSTFAQMSEGIKFSTDFRKFLSIKPTIVDNTDSIDVENTPPKIEFVNVRFKYPKSSNYIFENLNLTINSGESLALVGENGAGKSTIVKLILRFYKLEGGRIEINGIDINDISIESLLHQTAVLFQEFNQYTLTARDNIAISDKKASMKKVRSAAALSGADKIIEKLPFGFDTYLNPTIEGGAELSGGQWQKVALARAFYRRPNFLILDEPTSAIDAKAEAEIFNNIFQEHSGKTALIISHRFSTVRKADRVIVLDKGRVVEQGTHTELMQTKGLYSEMFNKQAEGYLN